MSGSVDRHRLQPTRSVQYAKSPGNYCLVTTILLLRTRRFFPSGGRNHRQYSLRLSTWSHVQRLRV